MAMNSFQTGNISSDFKQPIFLLVLERCALLWHRLGGVLLLGIISSRSAYSSSKSFPGQKSILEMPVCELGAHGFQNSNLKKDSARGRGRK
jgi:hypothetical protein